MPFPPVIPITAAMLAAQQANTRIHRKMRRNNTGLFPFQVLNEATSGSIDVTGWTFRLTAKYAIPNPDAQAAFQLDNQDLGGIALVTPTLGQCLGTLAPGRTSNYPDGPVEVDYDIQATDTEGVITTVEFGHLVIDVSVTDTIT
jgi:hypothetical protein